MILLVALWRPPTVAAELRAGVGRVEITDRSDRPVNDPLYAKALILESGTAKVVLITIDAVAIGEIGRIGQDFLPEVRERLQKELGIAPAGVVVNASHCHGVPRADAADLTVQAVKMASEAMVPVKVGTGSGQENRISENRRVKMKDGTEIDMRRAYAMPTDENVAATGPIDPQIGILRIDRLDGTPLAVLYNFACHPIMNPPRKGNSADYPAFASRVIEETLGHGALAFFVQGCAGDINPIRYKEVDRPPDAEPLGTMLGLSVLAGWRKIAPADGDLKILSEMVTVPLATDFEARIAANQAEQLRLVQALKPTDINFKAFLPLLVQEGLWPDFPSHYAQGYLRDEALGQGELRKLDADNRASVAAYRQNIQTMEQLTRLNTNLALLKKHLAQQKAMRKTALDVEMVALRVGDFRLVTFPGELTVQVGLNVKKAATAHPNTYVAGYTNGYIYYLPTVEQRGNRGYAQEDCDCIVAPGWQAVFEEKARAILEKL